jgi:hypothetical protein
MKKYMKKNTGGVVAKDTAPTEVYAGAGSNVVKEAKARKRGGKAMGKMSGDKAPKRADRMARKSGGMCSSDWSAASGPGQKPAGRKTQ